MNAPAPAGWLRGPAFDLGLIVGVTTLALTLGSIAVLDPHLFMPLMMIDLWVFGYHHLVATYTRLCFDGEARRSHRFLLWGLPFVILAGTLSLAFGLGMWSLASVFFYWQWFHYARQSWGLSQAYRRKAGKLITDNPKISEAMFYLLPLWGLLHRSWQDPQKFLFLDIRLIPVPKLAEQVVAAAAIASVIWWAWTRFQAWRRGELALAHTIFMVSHFTIFYVAYIAIQNVSTGWLVVNVWHNAQYIFFVWMYNNRKFEGGVSPAAPLLSWLSQNRRLVAYLGTCLAISTAAFLLIGRLAPLIVAPMVVYQTIFYHHYIVDGLIWKVRKPAMRQLLRLDA
jgi:hypothetical protein